MEGREVIGAAQSVRISATAAAILTVVALVIMSLGLGAAGQSAGLTAAEKQEGWKPLFDGQSLKGWAVRPPPAGRGAAANEPRPACKWAPENGELVWVKDSGRGYLVTEQVFNDFVLRLDFFADAAANTGVNFGVPDEGNISSQTSFEVNIFDDTTEFPTGSINNVQRTTVATPKTTDKWNAYEISRQGDHVMVVLNGEKVLDVKTTLHPGGHIGLQAPAAGVTRFKNLRIKAQ